jgi:hypothetical protein
VAFPTPSGLFVQTFMKSFDATQLALNLVLTTHKVALFTNSLGASDLTADVGYGAAPYNANETPNSGTYAAGGFTLANTTYVHIATGLVAWDNTVDPNWTTATLTARGGLYYADALAGKNGIVAQNFGSDITSTAGTFTIVLATPASGAIFGIDFVP